MVVWTFIVVVATSYYFHKFHIIKSTKWFNKNVYCFIHWSHFSNGTHLLVFDVTLVHFEKPGRQIWSHKWMFTVRSCHVSKVPWRKFLKKIIYKKILCRNRIKNKSQKYNVGTNKYEANTIDKEFSDGQTFVCILSDNHRKMVGIVNKLSESNAMQVCIFDLSDTIKSLLV